MNACAHMVFQLPYNDCAKHHEWRQQQGPDLGQHRPFTRRGETRGRGRARTMLVRCASSTVKCVGAYAHRQSSAMMYSTPSSVATAQNTAGASGLRGPGAGRTSGTAARPRASAGMSITASSLLACARARGRPVSRAAAMVQGRTEARSVQLTMPTAPGRAATHACDCVPAVMVTGRTCAL